MGEKISTIEFPELIFGIAGPIGVDVDAIQASLSNALQVVGYAPNIVKLTEHMFDFPVGLNKPDNPTYYDDLKFKIDYADELCMRQKDRAFLARLAVRAIIKLRETITKCQGIVPEKHAYIVRQLKRPQEVDLLRAVYGRQFILISAHGSSQSRREFLISKLRKTLPTRSTATDIACKADELMEIDQNEKSKPFGQNLHQTFPLGDVFIDGMSRPNMAAMQSRFVEAFFGRNDIAPTKAEYGMYAAKSASLRSSDLSRQVGAAIFTHNGELICQGCNEVPRAFGGTYWDQETPDFRDVRIGFDSNEAFKQHILRDLFERLSAGELLSDKALSFERIELLIEAVTRKSAVSSGADDDNPPDGILVGADIMDLTEYGRVVHAEMCAICDAARLGRSVKGGVLFSTTFPCHNCTKHIIASGITKVIFLEPYPKSKAKLLHANEISIEIDNSACVSFMPFIGISPFRYRDIFQKERRKDASGNALEWYADGPRPLLDIVAPSYVENEKIAYGSLFGSLPPAPSV